MATLTQNTILKRQDIEKILLDRLEQEILNKDIFSKDSFFRLIRFLKLSSIRGILFVAPSPAPFPKNEFINILKLSNEFIKQNNSKMYLVYLPHYLRYADKNIINDDIFLLKQVIEIVESLNIPLINMHEELFKKHKDPLSLFPFRKGIHYSEEAYQLIAKIVFDRIDELENK